MKRFVLLVLTFFALCQPLPALPHDPRLGWQTLSSPHFEIQFHAGLDALAPTVAALCERRFAELSETFKFHPDEKVQVVLADENDEANGGATALPYNTVYLIVAPPDDTEQVFDVDAWLDFVISHELVHIFQLDHSRGFPHFLRKIFGRWAWTMPNYYQPSWVLEGLAAWGETDVSRAVGRGQGPFFRGMMRLELEAGLKTIRRVNVTERVWPQGSTRYLYGVYFMEFLEDRYGKDGIRKWVENYSDDWIPYFINRNAKKTFKKKLPVLWADFRDWLHGKLDPEMEAIRAVGLKGQRAPVDSGGSDFWGPYKAGYAVRRDGFKRPHLQRLVKGRWQDVGEAYVSQFWPGAKRILYTEDEVTHQASLTRDLWQMDPTNGDRKRLTWGLRVQEAVELPTGAVLALLGDKGQKRLVRLEGGQAAETLWQGKDDETISSLCPSPDGLRLAASHWRRGRGWDIDEFELATATWTPAASRPEAEIHPSYSADGHTLYFSASYGGTYNIYAWDRAKKRLSQVTNVIGGAFHPWPGQDGQVYFSMLTAEGYALGESPLIADAPALKLGPGPSLPQLKPLTELELPSPRPYSPGPTLMPASWSPVLSLGRVGNFYGVAIGGDDVLGRHHFALTLYGVEQHNDGFGYAAYSYTRWLPELSVQASRGISRDPGEPVHDRVKEAWSALAGLPWAGTWRSCELWVGGGGSRISDELGNLDGLPKPDEYNRFAQGGFFYSAATQPLRALGPVDGIQASVSLTRIDPQDPNGTGWMLWGLSRPTALGHGFELEAAVGGGHVVQGDAEFSLAYALPKALAAPHAVELRPRFDLAGYSPGLAALQGPTFGAAHLGLRIPLALVEWGIMAPPMALQRLSGRIWLESAQAYDSAGSGKGPRSSVGVDFDQELRFFYAADVDLRIGYARGIDADGDDRIYVSIY